MIGPQPELVQDPAPLVLLPARAAGGWSRGRPFATADPLRPSLLSLAGPIKAPSPEPLDIPKSYPSPQGHRKRRLPSRFEAEPRQTIVTNTVAPMDLSSGTRSPPMKLPRGLR